MMKLLKEFAWKLPVVVAINVGFVLGGIKLFDWFIGWVFDGEQGVATPVEFPRFSDKMWGQT